MSSHNTLRFKVEYRDFRGLYSAQTLDQACFWRSKMCFQKFIIYILRYTHRKAPFIRTWVLAIQYVRKKNDTSNQIPRRRCVSLAPKFPPFLVLVGCSGLAMRIASQKFNAKVHTVRLKENNFCLKKRETKSQKFPIFQIHEENCREPTKHATAEVENERRGQA